MKVSDRWTSQDCAQLMRKLVDQHYPEAKVVTLLLDNLNTHTPASLYQTFEPEEARRIARRLEIQYTPKHDYWLNMAEIELSVLSRLCLDRRIPDQTNLGREVAGWQDGCNKSIATLDWRFTTDDLGSSSRNFTRRSIPDMALE